MASCSYLYCHFVFRTKYREAVLFKQLREELYQFLIQKSREIGSIIIEINGYADHIHILIRLNKNISVANLAKSLKGSSSRWINQKKVFAEILFRWQRGYYCETVSKRNLDQLRSYIKGQVDKHYNVEIEDRLKYFEADLKKKEN